MKKIKKVLYPVCGLIIAFALWNLWSIQQSEKHAEELYGALARQKDSHRETAQRQTERDGDDENNTDPADSDWLVKLKEQNDELAGWITIPGTVIDYPVMQTEEDNDYYLTHDFERSEDPHGTPFLDVNCRIGESENLIIYGHHMKDGTMFQNLMLYKDAGFCQSNGLILFETPGERAQYQIIYVLLMSEKDTEKFPYYKCVDLSMEEIYQGFLKQCSRYAIWSGEELPDPGTKLLTLSTCEYTNENGKLVVVAKQI